MDEMNPAFENFLNNMSRLGGTPRETTRRVSASSFLGKDNDIERRVNNNSKKISIIARILKSRRANTAGIEKSILDIKNTMSSIVQTLEAQEKFEYEKFLETQQQLENEKRRKRETATEKDKPLKDFFSKQVERIVAPVRNGFLRFIMFFVNLIAGKFIIGILKFLSNPRNIGIVNFISGFIEKFFPLILAGITAAGLGIVFLVGKMIGLTGILKLAAGIFGFAMPGGSIVKALGKTNFVKSAISAFKPTRLFLQTGGQLEGPSHKDGGIPIEAEGGEFIVNKKAMQQPGAATVVQMINDGRFNELAGLGGGGGGTDAITAKSSAKSFKKRVGDVAKIATIPARFLLNIKSKPDPTEKFADSRMTPKEKVTSAISDYKKKQKKVNEDAAMAAPTNNASSGAIAGLPPDEPPMKKKKTYAYGGRGSRKMWMNNK